MPTTARFPPDVVSALRAGRILGLRAGEGDHRFIGLWVVVVDGRAFVRSWSRKPDGWHAALRAHPRGMLQARERLLPFRAVFTRSERIKDAVSRAYREKYGTPSGMKYVRDLSRAPSRDTTTELVPVSGGTTGAADARRRRS